MQKTITVRGTGHATAKPDCVHILFSLVNKDKRYQNAMEAASYDLEALRATLALADISPDDLKTTGFSVRTMTSYHDGEQHFIGYAVQHDFKIVIDFDKDRLGKILEIIAKSCADPDLSVKFTVKDSTSIKDEIFRTAAANARNIAEALCKGSGASLGELLSINYSWQEVDFYSHTEATLGCDEKGDGAAPELTPDDIEANDSVTFVWALQ